MSGVVDIINKRFAHNMHALLCFTGESGIGKSYAAMRLAEQVDPSFNISRVAFSAHEFLKIVNQDLPKGSAIMWDEVGVGLDNRAWASVVNKLVAYVLQTVRYKNYLIIFTVPAKDFVDNRPNKLFTHIIEMKRKDMANGRTYGKMYKVRHISIMGETHYSKLHPSNNTSIRHVIFKMPSPKLCEAYENAHKVFKSELSKQAEAILLESMPTEKPLAQYRHRETGLSWEEAMDALRKPKPKSRIELLREEYKNKPTSL